jgi:hypothetical protein
LNDETIGHSADNNSDNDNKKIFEDWIHGGEDSMGKGEWRMASGECGPSHSVSLSVSLSSTNLKNVAKPKENGEWRMFGALL